MDIGSRNTEAACGVCAHRQTCGNVQSRGAAQLNQIGIVYNEDFNSGAILDGARFVNPFGTDFAAGA